MNRALPRVLAAVAGLAVAIAIAFVPAWRIETVVSESGLPAFLPIAAPPLGWTARAALMLLAALLVALPLWVALTLLGATRPTALTYSEAAEDELPPSVRRADAHPDAPPRPPVRAGRDLGAPFLDSVEPVEAEIALPRDLDTPMAMFDPQALPQVPAAPPPTVRPLFRPLDPEPELAEFAPIADPGPVDAPAIEPEPFAGVQSVPAPEPVEPVAPPAAASTTPAPSIATLLDRLDRGLQRRRLDRAPPASEPSPGLASALGALRRMAGGE
ncbi:hypothetical protein QLH51_10345 [Sphingomonas sp. 2R-10]|uniref:hypothetical protein n=1 Tax=Sphingomonas sp. 2R-10 TaxID=3045148 RepID=UPI000F78CDB4|nr:hypothetical protein [Sphingomonas sp. 2R-10]MDJ0277193.1 hypothetical protein [Sphingomonas sp. 2R-10]